MQLSVFSVLTFSKTLKCELFVEALCKVHGEIEAEFRDEANVADPYRVAVVDSALAP